MARLLAHLRTSVAQFAFPSPARFICAFLFSVEAQAATFFSLCASEANPCFPFLSFHCLWGHMPCHVVFFQDSTESCPSSMQTVSASTQIPPVRCFIRPPLYAFSCAPLPSSETLKRCLGSALRLVEFHREATGHRSGSSLDFFAVGPSPVVLPPPLDSHQCELLGAPLQFLRASSNRQFLREP